MVIKKELRNTEVINTSNFLHDVDPYARLNGTHVYLNQREFYT